MAAKLLKSARQAIDAQNYEEAKSKCLQILNFDDENYNALVFLGIVELNLENIDEARKVYKRAIELQPHMILAHQVRFVHFHFFHIS